MWNLLLWVFVGGYFLGCLHGSSLAQILSGVNLKKSGVNNAGASNATIVLGKKFGALVAAIDIAKGSLAIVFARIFAEQALLSGDMIWLTLFIAGAAVVLGHIFPFHMKFNGGKGTATIIGVLIGINWLFGLTALLLFIIASLVTDFIVFGVLTLYIALITIALWVTDGIGPFLIAASLFLLAIIKHLENFRRMRRGEEGRVSAVFWKKKIN